MILISCQSISLPLNQYLRNKINKHVDMRIQVYKDTGEID